MPKTSYEIDPKKQDESRIKSEEILAARQAVFAAANRCLQHEDFKKYRENLVKARSLIIRQMVDYQQANGDPVAYGIVMGTMATQIRDMEALLKDIEKDTRHNPNTEGKNA